jgi:regulator of RNase E activity RraA
MAEREQTPAGPAAEEPSSCDVSDACDELGIAACRSGALRPLWPGCAPVSGRLLTARLEPAAGAPGPLAELLELLARAGDRLVLIDLAGRVDHQCWGALLGQAALHHGVRGVLVNGAVRDVGELEVLGLPTYARGVHPAAAGGRVRVTALDQPVELEGGRVEPGSFAAVDRSGAVFFDARRAHEVRALAARRREQELEQRRAVAAGADPRAVFLAAENRTTRAAG